MNLFYHPDIETVDTEYDFTTEESQHIAKVLRKKTGDTINITNGKGDLFHCVITFQNQKICRFLVKNKQHFDSKNYKISIVIAPTKNIDRMEWFVEKATELGVDEIIPIITEQSERKVLKTERLEKIAIAAMKQSYQFYLPEIKNITTFKEVLQTPFYGKKYIAHCEETSRNSLLKSILKGENIQIWIGPEGDFSHQEINTCLQSGFIPVTLGNTRLRTETAGITAVHTVIIANE